jgi:hypothetical protein
LERLDDIDHKEQPNSMDHLIHPSSQEQYDIFVAILFHMRIASIFALIQRNQLLDNFRQYDFPNNPQFC